MYCPKFKERYALVYVLIQTLFGDHIQEKDDLEAQFRELKEKADHASSQHSALQQDLERTRQQANEALKAMDVDRQQLRSANNKYIFK